MQKKHHRFLQSVIALPIVAIHLATAPVSGALAGLPTAAAISPVQNGTLSSESAVNPQLAPVTETNLVAEAAKIDAYFAQRHSPLVGYGLKMAKTAEDNGLPYQSIAALVTIESNAGLMACSKDKENIAGIQSCKGMKFDTYDQAIDVVGRTLGGKVASNAYAYENKTLNQKFVAYNGDANPLYVKKLTAVMSQIDQMSVTPDTEVASATGVKV